MNTSVFAFIGGGIGMPEIVLVLAVVLILFGAKKLPELARGMGQGIKEFKKASREVQDDLNRALEEDERREDADRRSKQKAERASSQEG